MTGDENTSPKRTIFAVLTINTEEALLVS